MPILPPLPRPQRRRIHKIIHATRDKGHARRLMAILLLHEGRTITDVHHLTGAARSTIGRWLRWYRDEGIDALYRKLIKCQPHRLWQLTALLITAI